MEHSFLDKYSNLNSLIHKLDPRVKILSFFLYILFVISTSPLNFFQFAIFLVIIFIVIFISHVPVIYILKKSIVIIPYVILVAVFIPFIKKSNGLLILWNITIKSFLSILSMIILSSTTKFPILLKGLEALHFPKILIILLSFMYRYIFILIDETMRMYRAWCGRYFGGEYKRQVKIFGNIIGVLFIRTYERAERIYQNMTARGFNGKIRTLNRLKFTFIDILFFILFFGIIIAVKIL